MPITRTAIHDDDGTGHTGTVIDNAWKQELYNQIDALMGNAGLWTDVPYSAANFQSNTGTWTVEAGDIAANRYTLIGKTMIWQVQLGTASVGSAANYLYLTVPTGVIQTVAPTRAAIAKNNGVLTDVYASFGNGSLVLLAPVDGSLWAAAANNTLLAITIILALA